MRVLVDRVIVAGLAAPPDPSGLHAAIEGELARTLTGETTRPARLRAVREGHADAAPTMRVEVPAGEDLGRAIGAAIAGAVKGP